MSINTEVLRRLDEIQLSLNRAKEHPIVVELSERVIELKNQIAEFEINRSVEQEKHEREKREVQHFVGLEKKRQELEIDMATREATLSVKESNLEADKKRFEEHIAFVEKRMDTHLKDMKDLLTSVMERIPTVTVSRES